MDIYIWHCPINCLFDLCEKKDSPGKQITGPKPELPRTAQRASQAAIQPASQPRSQRLWPPGRPADQPASQGPEQPGSGTGPQKGSKVCPMWRMPQTQKRAGLEKDKMGPKAQLSKTVQGTSQPVSRSASQSATRPALPAARPAGWPASQPGPRAARLESRAQSGPNFFFRF